MQVRRIDDFGRIAIPKEIRKTLSIHEGDELEISRSGNTIVIKKPYAEKYYTPEDVENMTLADLADERIWEDIRKSMPKWKGLGDNNAE